MISRNGAGRRTPSAAATIAADLAGCLARRWAARRAGTERGFILVRSDNGAASHGIGPAFVIVAVMFPAAGGLWLFGARFLERDTLPD